MLDIDAAAIEREGIRRGAEGLSGPQGHRWKLMRNLQLGGGLKTIRWF